MQHRISRDSHLASLEVSNLPRLTQSHTFDDFRLMGNEFFKRSQYCQALVVYSNGLISHPNSEVLLLNRAKTFFKLKMFTNCLDDCDRILLSDPSNRPALLCRFKALSHLSTTNDIPADNKDFQLLSKSVCRLQQESEGNFDFPQLYRENLRSNQKRLDDHSDYIGPVAIQHFLNAKGRGLVATKDIQPGQLILVSKALECAFHSDKLDQFESPFDELLQRLTDRSLVDPQALQQLLQLYSGPDVDQLSEGEEVSLAEDIMKDANRREKLEAMCDRVVMFNGYGRNNPNGQAEQQSSFNFATFNGMGLWVSFASLFNHQCHSNATSLVVGDMMFIRAVRHIKCGEEITQPYCVPIGDLQDRQDHLSRYGFTCDCRLCKFDLNYELENKSQVAKRKKLFEQIMSVVYSVTNGQTTFTNSTKNGKLLKMAETFQKEFAIKSRFDVEGMIIWKSIGNICLKENETELAQTAYKNAIVAWRGNDESDENFISVHSCTAEIPILQQLAKLTVDKDVIESRIKMLLEIEYGVTDLSLVCLSP